MPAPLINKQKFTNTTDMLQIANVLVAIYNKLTAGTIYGGATLEAQETQIAQTTDGDGNSVFVDQDDNTAYLKKLPKIEGQLQTLQSNSQLINLKYQKFTNTTVALLMADIEAYKVLNPTYIQVGGINIVYSITGTIISPTGYEFSAIITYSTVLT